MSERGPIIEPKMSIIGFMVLRLYFDGIFPDRRGLRALPPRYGSSALQIVYLFFSYFDHAMLKDIIGMVIIITAF